MFRAHGHFPVCVFLRTYYALGYTYRLKFTLRIYHLQKEPVEIVCV